MNQDERETQLLLEQICGPLDEILAIHQGGLSARQSKAIKEVRERIEHLLLEYEAMPGNPDLPGGI